MSNVFPFARADGGGVETDSAPIGHECERFCGIADRGSIGACAEDGPQCAYGIMVLKIRRDRHPEVRA
jgi:hypothetical protein